MSVSGRIPGPIRRPDAPGPIPRPIPRPDAAGRMLPCLPRLGPGPQHLHLPEFFEPAAIRIRETTYRQLCEQASMVAVATDWVKRDIVRQYGLPDEKVEVIPLAPILGAYPAPGPGDLAATSRRLSLPDRFVLYPALTWEHKNHIALLEALAELNADGLRVPLVCSGSLTDHHARIAERATQLGVAGQVTWVGFIPTATLRCLYGLASAVVVPTLFEAASAPVWEAFQAGVPVACSTVTSLPEQVRDAAILFDPRDVSGMAAAVRRLWTDPDLADALVARGHERIAALSWDRTARTFRDHYRRIVRDAHRGEGSAV